MFAAVFQVTELADDHSLPIYKTVYQGYITAPKSLPSTQGRFTALGPPIVLGYQTGCKQVG